MSVLQGKLARTGKEGNGGAPEAHLLPCLSNSEQRLQQTMDDPVTVVQIGEGNFLRGFFDWMIHEARCQGIYQGSIAVSQPRPSGKAKLDALKRQNGQYTLVMRGLSDGVPVERTEIISVFSQMIDPYSEWDRFLRLAEQPHLQFVISNTTEAGLVFCPESMTEGEPVESFPGKMTLFLYRRYLTFRGEPDKGLIFLPCELLERNGDELRDCILRYCEDWGLPAPFIRWVNEHNRFLNSLVDRIVTGYPDTEADAWFAEWGYRDDLLCTAELYHLWAIEAEPELEEKLPLRRAGLNVHWVDDLTEYRLLKVRLLNGAHTLMTPLALLYGLEHVREVMGHRELGAFVRRTIEDEIIPSLPVPEAESRRYAESVYERFLNPFIRHRLSDIAMNSVSKFKVRLLPSLLYYRDRGETLPQGLVRAFAGLLRYYRVSRTEKGYEGISLNGDKYRVNDDRNVMETFAYVWGQEQTMSWVELARRLLGLENLWGTDLAAIADLSEAVAGHWERMEMRG
ncbi:Altronate oxidoreductase [Chlamydia abortus]|uniref:Tagaturonate reductase n=1 Tax=Paenibacillus residui TaxID=629724 RepID=A0ABW3D8R1_9BACL|nr:tagaturonate reductase [Paenibacillus sp. 32O-W]SHE14209.1 Altronate oxidoreductase [Chlamydia abortus]